MLRSCNWSIWTQQQNCISTSTIQKLHKRDPKFPTGQRLLDTSVIKLLLHIFANTKPRWQSQYIPSPDMIRQKTDYTKFCFIMSKPSQHSRRRKLRLIQKSTISTTWFICFYEKICLYIQHTYKFYGRIQYSKSVKQYTRRFTRDTNTGNSRSTPPKNYRWKVIKQMCNRRGFLLQLIVWVPLDCIREPISKNPKIVSPAALRGKASRVSINVILFTKKLISLLS